ncbi:MAG: Outer rane receptor for ferrienterochelin and colicin [Acidobacteria bacterium]|nr:Outer rane receptor for ferrienterochelin and colicin [Acidobacteriota bacterium]
MRKNSKFLITVLSLVFCLSGIAFGQEINGTIEGYVKDPSGAVVPNVTVTIQSTEVTENNTRTSVATGFTRTLTSSGEGFFRAQQVPPGIYTVTTSATSGFGATTLNNVNVGVGRTTQLDINLTIGQGTTVVDVTAGNEAGAIDPTASQTTTNITTRQIETIPAGTSFDSLLRLSPQTRPEAKSGGFQVDGASGSENSFIIDGQDVSNFKSNNLNGVNNIPTTLVQEISIKTSGFDAEFGGATGGVVSVVTKGGSNQFRGIFGAEFESSKLNASPRPSLVRVLDPTTANGNTAEYVAPPKTGATNFFPTAQISGPIIKDRLFGLVNYSKQIFENTRTSRYFNNAVSSRRVLSNQVEYKNKTIYEYAFARLDANPFNSLRLTGTYLWNPQINEGGILPGSINIGTGVPSAVLGGIRYTGADLIAQQGGRVNSNNVTFQAVYTPTSNLVLTGRFSRGFLNEKPTAYGVPNGTRLQCSAVPAVSANQPINYAAISGCAQGFENFGVNRLTNKEVSIKTNYEVDASYNLNGFLGNHQLKGGYSNSKIFTDIDSNSNVTTGQVQLFYGRTIGSLTPIAVSSTPGAIGAGVISRFGQIASGFNRNQGIYIQDKWQPVRNLTLNIGVRAEKEFIPTFNGVPIQVAYGYGDKIAPRLGFAYDPFGDGKTKIFGSYGKFYDRLKFELPAGSFGGDFFRRDYFEIFAGERYDSFTLANILGNYQGPSGGECPRAATGTRVRCHIDLRVPSLAAVDLKPFTQRELTFGVEREFFGNMLFTARYTNKEVLNAVEDAGAFNKFNSEVYTIVNPCKGEHLKIIKEGGYAGCVEAERKYNAFQLIAERRFTRGLYFNANYTFSRLVGNYSGLASSDENGRDDPGVTRYFDIPAQGFAVATGKPDNGRLATDRPHVFNLYGSYTYDWFGSKTNESTLSLFTTVQSGTPLTTTVELFANEIILNGRGDLGRTETFSRSDISLQHRYLFGRDDKFAMIFNINVENLLNEHNVTDVFRLITDVGIDISAEDVGFSDPDPNNPPVPNATTRAINAAITKGLGAEIRSLLMDPKLVDPRYNATNPFPTAFQAPRRVRFGFRFQF